MCAQGEDGQASMASRVASCAFMDRLDLRTTAVYPHELPRRDDESKERPPARFPLNSFTAVCPVLIGIGNLTIHVFRPYVLVGLFLLAGYGIASIYCAAVGACLVAYLFLFDERFLQSERPSSLAPGLHCRPSPRSDAIVSMVSTLRYPHYKGTPWIVGGDVATLFPFLAFGLLDFTLPVVEYTRRWLTVDEDDTRKTGGNDGKARKRRGVDGGGTAGPSDSPGGLTDCGGIAGAVIEGSAHGDGGVDGDGGGIADDKEAVALDIALPEKGLDPAKPFYLVLHGLTGGSAEPYVLDFVRHALRRGCGVCVMISRGCMGTPVRGYSIFHGARISDARSTVQALRRSLPDQTPLAMVGYSMGGIVAMNYVALSGAESGVSSCVSMAGSLDTRTNMGARHSQRVWQPILARALKEHFVVNNESKILARGLDMAAIERCKNVLDIDTHLVAPYNGYPDVTSYYVDMSAAADDKIAGLRTPTLAVSSLDDPIMTGGGWPSTSLKETKDLFVLLTRKGGHVGWPTGWFPTRNRWGWMSTASLDFCEAVLATAAL